MINYFLLNSHEPEDLNDRKKPGILIKYAKRLILNARGPAKVIPYPVIDALPMPRLNISPRSSNLKDLSAFPFLKEIIF